jgi:radical SAM-linked protein
VSRQPEGPPPPPVVQRLRVRYAKRGRLRFTSHRDVARAFERAVRRAGLPIAFSAGFSPHPKLSYAGASPTGVASEAEYLELGLAEVREPDAVRAALDAALPAGIDVLEVADAAAAAGATLAEQIEASFWRVDLPQVSVPAATGAVAALLECESAPVERVTRDGTRTIDARAALVSVSVTGGPPDGHDRDVNGGCATLEMVVRHSTPAVRPDDILAALRSIGALSTPVTPVVTRLAQGLLDNTSPEGAKRLVDPFGRPGESQGRQGG